MLCLGTFVIAQVHFVSEMLCFGTLALAPGSISPIVVSSMYPPTHAACSAAAMIAQFRHYIA